MARGRDTFDKFEGIINLFIMLLNVFPKSLRLKIYGVFQNKKGISGIAIRYIILKTLSNHCGRNVSIHPNVILLHIEKISLGDNVSIHPFSYLDGAGRIRIGDDVSIAHGTSILSSSHNFGSQDIPIKDQGMSFDEVVIEDNVWIGAKATILNGRTIETGSIIGANSIVTKDVKQNWIVGGNPAHKIKER